MQVIPRASDDECSLATATP